MDELACPASSGVPPFPVSFSAVSHDQHPPALEFMSCDEILEQWLLGKQDEEEPRDGRRAIQPPPPAPFVERSRPGAWKPGPRTCAPAMSHVEAERQRRDRLNRRFCDLRAAVPRVSRMDRASLLSDAVAYIAELRGRVEQLEKEASRRASLGHCSLPGAPEQEDMALEAWMIGPEAAALRLRTAAERHAPARLMAALRALDLPVHHVCVCRVGGVTVQDVVVDVPSAGLRREGQLRAALRGLLLQESG
ncbi:hypothetical protein SEVIR_5G096000v4 [Setaria viridis]|uniref:Transcription factor n=1 Tax=Setaria viridis TaxID=4556 RepID=A0A4V6D684_SETVI|nr:transcription factor bHLH14-like [Setaria viridis]TKW13366.1 hypothetical protein SEVIR_5G096000v2 [Setaria viridis]